MPAFKANPASTAIGVVKDAKAAAKDIAGEAAAAATTKATRLPGVGSLFAGVKDQKPRLVETGIHSGVITG